jgi:hypothetical protein
MEGAEERVEGPETARLTKSPSANLSADPVSPAHAHIHRHHLAGGLGRRHIAKSETRGKVVSRK